MSLYKLLYTHAITISLAVSQDALFNSKRKGKSPSCSTTVDPAMKPVFKTLTVKSHLNISQIPQR